MLGKGLRLILGHMQVRFIASVRTFFPVNGQVTFLNGHRTLSTEQQHVYKLLSQQGLSIVNLSRYSLIRVNPRVISLSGGVGI